jgi:4-alpha-glucanotransferase
VTAPIRLDELAGRAGIEPAYYDIWGGQHVLSADTKRAFLAAMGIAAATEEEVALSIASLAAKPWRRALEPVVILSEGQDRPVAALVCAAKPAGTVAWRITTEDGARQDGTVALGDLPLAETERIAGRAHERRLLALPEALPLGYHRLEVAGEATAGASCATTLIVAPRQAYLPDALRRGPGLWGLSLQLYALQGRKSWGLGDFGDLAGFAAQAAHLGAGALGLNPLHALYPGNPAHASPYSPSSRCFLNPLYIAIEAVPDFAQCERTTDADLAALRAAPLIDYAAAAAAKLPWFELLYAAFRTNHLAPGTARAAAFRAFQRQGGGALHRFSLFEALAEHLRGGRPGHLPWRLWPAPYRDPESAETAEFARDHADRVIFRQYLQWEADRQLGCAAAACARGGMPVGLYRDLALAVDADGADAWSEQALIAAGISTGAPPDDFALQGQSWGLPPFNPHALRDAAYRPFIACLRANMRHAGALRIDHVMGFARLFWIPAAAPPAAGGYVRYPLDELLAIAALESRRAGCAIVGEDLGTVPAGLRERLNAAGILSMRLLYFERRDDGGFRAAESYPELAHVAIGTHDLPTFPGYWREHDIALRAALGLLPAPDSEMRLRQDRARARAALIALLYGAGLLPSPDEAAADIPELVDAAYRFLAATPSRLLMVHLEDLLGVMDQVNLPGTVEEHPNWRRKLPLRWEDLATLPQLRRLAEALSRRRPA